MEIRSAGLGSTYRRMETAWADSLRRVSERPGNLRASLHVGQMTRQARSEAVIRGSQQALANIQDSLNLLQVAESGVALASEHLLSIRNRALQAAQGSLTNEERSILQAAVIEDLKAIEQLALDTSYNGHRVLLGGTLAPEITLGETRQFTRGTTRTVAEYTQSQSWGSSQTGSSQTRSAGSSSTFQLSHNTPRWSSDGDYLSVRRGHTTLAYGAEGSVALDPSGRTFDTSERRSFSVPRTTTVVDPEGNVQTVTVNDTWELSTSVFGYNGLYARKNGGAWTRLSPGYFYSYNAEATFSPTGDRIALVRNKLDAGASIEILNFDPVAVRSSTRVPRLNVDGDTAGVSTTYAVPFNLYEVQGQPSIRVLRISPGSSTVQVPYDSTNGFSSPTAPSASTAATYLTPMMCCRCRASAGSDSRVNRARIRLAYLWTTHLYATIWASLGAASKSAVDPRLSPTTRRVRADGASILMIRTCVRSSSRATIDRKTAKGFRLPTEPTTSFGTAPSCRFMRMQQVA